ncbi:hypothetical protein BDR03DRAFT_1017473 [Suillus americanus]|nr:hypothetical protein BDR03DRAFT_1017473 [Suillus americanus]
MQPGGLKLWAVRQRLPLLAFGPYTVILELLTSTESSTRNCQTTITLLYGKSAIFGTAAKEAETAFEAFMGLFAEPFNSNDVRARAIGLCSFYSAQLPTVVRCPRLAFAEGQAADRNLISALTYVKLQPCDQITLTGNFCNDLYFSASLAFVVPYRRLAWTLETRTNGFLQVVNETVLLPGFLDLVDEFALVAALFRNIWYIIFSSSPPQETHSRQRRGGSNEVKTTRKLILSVYITSDDQENEILLGAIDTPVIWIKDKIWLHRTRTGTSIGFNKSTR